jgi:hypothetical protein
VFHVEGKNDPVFGVLDRGVYHGSAPAKDYCPSYIDLKATVNHEIKWVAGRME